MAITERVRKTDGIKTYIVDFRCQYGHRHREHGGTNRTDARSLLTVRLGEVRLETYKCDKIVDAETQGRRAFSEMVPDFLAEHLTATGYTGHAIKAAVSYFGGKPVADVTVGDFDGFRAHLHGEGLGPSTVRKYMTAAGTLFKWARRKGWIVADPSADAEKPSEPHHKVRFLTAEEWALIEAAAPAWLRDLMMFAVQSGARLREVVELTWSDVDFQRGMIYFSERNKTGKPRTVPLNDSLRAVLKRQVRHVRSAFVFVNGEGNPYTDARSRNNISRRTTAVMDKAGIEGGGFHLLRHTAASWLVQKGVPLTHVQEILGHASPIMTMRYAHLKPEHLSASMALLSEAMMGNMEPSNPAAMDTPVDKTDGSATGSEAVRSQVVGNEAVN